MDLFSARPEVLKRLVSGTGVIFRSEVMNDGYAGSGNFSVYVFDSLEVGFIPDNSVKTKAFLSLKGLHGNCLSYLCGGFESKSVDDFIKSIEPYYRAGVLKIPASFDDLDVFELENGRFYLLKEEQVRTSKLNDSFIIDRGVNKHCNVYEFKSKELLVLDLKELLNSFGVSESEHSGICEEVLRRTK